MIQIDILKDLTDTEHWESPYTGGNALSYLPSWARQGQLVVERNGELIPARDVKLMKIRDGDRLAIALVPGFEPITWLFILSAVLTVGTMALSVFNAFQRPNIDIPDSQENYEETPTRGFTGAQNTVGGGVVIPIIYGKVRSPGHIIETFTSVKYNYEDTTDPDKTFLVEDEQEDESVRRLNTRIAHCWGPIEGVSDIEIDDNEISKLKGVNYQSFLGTKFQAGPDGFQDNKVQTSVGTYVSVAGGTASQTTARSVDNVEVALNFRGGLNEIDNNAQLVETEVQARFRYRITGEGWAEWTTITITESKRTQFYFWIRFPKFDQRAVYDIEIERVTADNSDPKIQNDFWWEYLTEIQFGNRSLPMIANTAIQQIPMQQSSVPSKYTFLIKGKNNIRVYTDENTYAEKWTSNPAWIAADAICDPIHGLGRYYTYEDNLNVASFLEWAVHCDTGVSSGRGTEKRCEFNMAVDSRMKIRDLLQLIASNNDGSLIEEGGSWRAVVDGEQVKVLDINEGDYVRNSLVYSFLETANRATRISVNYLNEEHDFRRDIMVQEDPNLTVGEYLWDQTINGWGITQPGHAGRLARKLFNANRLEDRVVEFQAGLKALPLKAGDRIGIATRTAGIAVANGKILAVSTDLLTLTLDEEFTLDPATSYEVAVVHQIDGTASTKIIVDHINVKTNMITVANARWERTIQAGDAYFLGEIGDLVEDFRISNISFESNFSRRIRASYYDSNVYVTSPISNPTTSVAKSPKPTKIPREPIHVSAKYRKPLNSGSHYVNVLDVAWNVPDQDQTIPVSDETYHGAYEVHYRQNGKLRWRKAGITRGTHLTIAENIVVDREYDIKVVPISNTGHKLSLDDTSTLTVTATS